MTRESEKSPGGAAAQSDPLTGLADRLHFSRRLGEMLADADPGQRAIGLYALNLDGFRRINTLYGSSVGDQVLKAVAERLTATMTGATMIARLGGDEFAVIYAPPPPRREADAL